MSQIAPHGGPLIKSPGRWVVLRHLIGASKQHAMHDLREVSSLTGAVPVILTVSFKVAGPSSAYDCHGVTRCRGAQALQTKGLFECHRQCVSAAHSVRTRLSLVYSREVVWREIARCVTAHGRLPLPADRWRPADRRDDHLRGQGQ